MKNMRQRPKCGSGGIARLPDRRGHYASGNNIYLSSFQSFCKAPVIRYVCCACGYVKKLADDADDLVRIRKKFLP